MSSLRRVKFLVSSALALVALVTSLSGCATIPSASQVIQGPDIQNQLTNDYLYYSPAGPVDGESAADILAGFLNASTGPQNDFGVARQYLSPHFRTKWSPNQLVYIQRGGQKTKIAADGSATVSLGVSATVDAVGHYTVGKTGAKATLHFKLVKSNGQWRISSAPNALVMIRPVFEVIFHSYEVYFFDRSYRYLIPDLRWFPARASTATRLVGALLAGPSPWLSPAVGPLLSSETKLAIDAVTVEKETAIVNLSSEILKAPRLDLERFTAEIKATLTQLAGIESVEIQADSVPQKVRIYTPASLSTSAFAPVVLTIGSLQQLIGPAGSRLDNASDWIPQLQVRDFAVTSNETGVALVGEKGVYSARLDGLSKAPTLVDTRKALLSPRYDNRGQLWLVGADGRVQVIAGKSKPVWLTIPWLKDHVLKTYTISPEGSRMAAVVEDAEGTTRLLVAAIVRNGAGLPTGFGTPIELNYGVGLPVSLQWAGESGIMVLADISATSSNITQLNIGGDPREVGTLDHANTLMTSSDGSNIYVLDDAGRVLEYQGYTWTELQSGVIAAHMAN